MESSLSDITFLNAQSQQFKEGLLNFNTVKGPKRLQSFRYVSY